MNAVSGWAAALCVAAIGCTALQMLAPKGGLGKLFKMISAAFFICCMASPLLSLKDIQPLSLDSTVDGDVSGELQEQVITQMEEQTAAAFYQTAQETLKNYAIEVAKVEVEMDMNENGGIYITKLILYLDKQNTAYTVAAKQVMQQRLGVEVEVLTLPE